LKIQIPSSGIVSALLTAPAHPIACFVFAHGAGAGMNHPFMAAVASGLSARNVATLRYQFPYMEKGQKRTDRPPIAHEAVRAAVAAAGAKFGNLPLIAGGKSFGGRMTSQAQALSPLTGVVGLAFFGFPLHPTGKPSVERAVHLADVDVPMLFLQGSKDTLADLALVKRTVTELKKTTLVVVEQADHSFHVPKSTGRTDQAVLEELLDAFVGWAKPN
jgi:predicted alpha/beta-hydrolase family hydrolase